MKGTSRSKDDGDETTLRVGAAKRGDRASLEWLVERFSPALIADARYRMPAALRRHVDPEDVVADVWAIALPRLPDLREAGGRGTPVVLRFLATTLLLRVRGMVRKHLAGKPATRALAPSGEAEDPEGTPIPAAEITEAASRVSRRERSDALRRALDALPERDRSLVFMRGVEGLPYAEISAVLKAPETSLSVAYARALKKLKAILPGSLFDDLDDEAARDA